MMEQMCRENLKAPLEAVLFASGDPISIGQLVDILQTDQETVAGLLQMLQDELEARGSGLALRKVAGGWQMVTRPEEFPYVTRLTQVVDRKLSAPTMETLSIIAFRQPITKQEIEHIRGVRAERALQKLLELELIHEAGRKPVIGRPILYATTEDFLRVFGLASLEELPSLPDLEEPADLDAEQLELVEQMLPSEAAEQHAPADDRHVLPDKVEDGGDSVG